MPKPPLVASREKLGHRWIFSVVEKNKSWNSEMGD